MKDKAPHQPHQPHDSRIDLVLAKLDQILSKLEAIMAVEDDILAKVQAQATVIESVKTLVESLKANQADPTKLAAIVSGLDANNAALAVVAGTDTPPATPAP